MKKLFTLSLVIILTLSAFAQAPQKMSYQCVVRNASGVLVTNQSVGIRIRILQGSATGAIVYKETYSPNPQTNANGLVIIEIGGGFPIIGTFSAINWADGPYFLETETDPTGGTNYTILGTSQLLSVPYAFYAKEAGNGFSGNYDDLTNIPTIFNSDWANITGKPTTIAGYGITDAVNTTGNQTIAGNKTFTGTINTSSHNITNVANPVNAQDAATKAYVDALEGQIIMLKNTLKAGGIVMDIDGNPYNTVVIGTQTWMAENLKTTKYKDGTSILLITDNSVWANLSTSAYCWPKNDITNKATYGALYNAYAVNTSKLCPSGWHVPSHEEWHTLVINFDPNADLSGILNSIAGGKLKEIGTTHWLSPNTGADNESGFSALPGGARYSNGTIEQIGGYAYFWSSTASDTECNWSYFLSYNNALISWGGGSYLCGMFIRCLKDN